jgi:hypothetical protein
MKVGGEFNPRPNTFMYNKENSHMKDWDPVLESLKEDGTIERLRIWWWYKSMPPRKCYEHRKLYNGLTLQNTGGVFMIVAGGVLLTLVTLWIENWYYDMRTKADILRSKMSQLMAQGGSTSQAMALMAPTNKDRPKLKRVKCTIL